MCIIACLLEKIIPYPSILIAFFSILIIMKVTKATEVIMPQHIPVLLYHQQNSRSPKIFIRSNRLEKTFPLHSHDFYELELVTSGSGRNWINNLCVPIRTGSLYLLSPSDVHRMEVDEPMNLYCIQFLPDALAAAGLSDPREALFSQFEQEEYAEILRLFDAIRIEEQHALPYSHALMASNLTQVLVRLLRSGTRCAAAASSRKMQQALDAIKKYYADPTLRQKTVSDICGLSVCHFSTTFRSVVGCSFSEYLVQYRLNHACALLSDTTETVTEIAYESGFSSLPHFFRVFRDNYGCTPLQYRQQNLRSASASPDKSEIPL